MPCSAQPANSDAAIRAFIILAASRVAPAMPVFALSRDSSVELASASASVQHEGTPSARTFARRVFQFVRYVARTRRCAIGCDRSLRMSAGGDLWNVWGSLGLDARELNHLGALPDAAVPWTAARQP